MTFINNPKKRLKRALAARKHKGEPVIFMKRTDEGPVLKCGCGELEYGPESNMGNVMVVAQAHRTLTGHQLRGFPEL